MAIKRIIGRYTKKQRKCLRCGEKIEKALYDDIVYNCESCGQLHYVDIYKDTIVLTVVEHPEVRRRPKRENITEQSRARQKLIAKVNTRRMEATAWEETYRDWLQELAEMPEQQREIELSLMEGELLRRVTQYLEKRFNE